MIFSFCSIISFFFLSSLIFASTSNSSAVTERQNVSQQAQAALKTLKKHHSKIQKVYELLFNIDFGKPIWIILRNKAKNQLVLFWILFPLKTVTKIRFIFIFLKLRQEL